MSFWDNVKKLTQPYADDDYDDYDEDEESVDEYDQPEERPARRASHRASSAPAPAPARVTAEEPAEDDDFGFNPTLTTPSQPLCFHRRFFRPGAEHGFFRLCHQ